MISVIIPTYKAVKHLDLCLHSFLLTSEYNTDEAIVVVDNTAAENKDVIEKYKNESKIKFVVKQMRSGMCVSQNIGASLAKNAKILVINDDMVFPHHWSSTLDESLTSYNQVVSCPLIERTHSTWLTVHTKDFGTIIGVYPLASICFTVALSANQKPKSSSSPSISSQIVLFIIKHQPEKCLPTSNPFVF